MSDGEKVIGVELVEADRDGAKTAPLDELDQIADLLLIMQALSSLTRTLPDGEQRQHALAEVDHVLDRLNAVPELLDAVIAAGKRRPRQHPAEQDTVDQLIERLQRRATQLIAVHGASGESQLKSREDQNG